MVEQDSLVDIMTMNSMMMMMSDDNSHIDDNRQDNNSAMILRMNHRIWFVRIRDDYHELKAVQYQHD